MKQRQFRRLGWRRCLVWRRLGGGRNAKPFNIAVHNRQDFWPIDRRLRARYADLAGYVLAGESAPRGSELSLSFVDDDEMAELNLAHMGQDGPTDVLAFPIDDTWQQARRRSSGQPQPEPSPQPKPTPPPNQAPLLIGEIVICPRVAQRNAPNREHNALNYEHKTLDGTSAEIALLLAHGVLHLCGYDHGNPDERDIMFGLQQSYLTNYFAQSRGRRKP